MQIGFSPSPRNQLRTIKVSLQSEVFHGSSSPKFKSIFPTYKIQSRLIFCSSLSPCSLFLQNPGESRFRVYLVLKVKSSSVLILPTSNCCHVQEVCLGFLLLLETSPQTFQFSVQCREYELESFSYSICLYYGTWCILHLPI